MIVYLTYNDYPSGIYSSQVIGVVTYVKENVNKSIRLIAFVSLRNFLFVRAEIKKELPDAIVLPMFPKIINWDKNYFLLLIFCRLLKVKTVISRGVLATQLALKLKKAGVIEKVIYNGRGAIAAEWKEYKVVKSMIMVNQIEQLEKQAVLEADYRIAVSNKLVEHWKSYYNYQDNKHVIIPCTLNKIFEKRIVNEVDILTKRKELGFSVSDILFIYSGSIAGWQSFNLNYDFLKYIYGINDRIKTLFLSDLNSNIMQLKKEFPDRVVCKKVSPREVPDYLIIGDYGLLIRERSITNEVASPVKFAEYLASGLNIIISEGVGDFTRFVYENKCGFNYSKSDEIDNVSMFEKNKNINLAQKYFTKEQYLVAYKDIFNDATV